MQVPVSAQTQHTVPWQAIQRLRQLLMMISFGTLVNVKLYAYRNEAIGADDDDDIVVR